MRQKKNRTIKEWYNMLDKCFQAMHHGQTNGIPQGSVLSDFIAELVLGYCDYIVGEKLKEEKIEDYFMLRYRDDIIIFTNCEKDGEDIMKTLSTELSEYNFKLNKSKTLFFNRYNYGRHKRRKKIFNK